MPQNLLEQAKELLLKAKETARQGLIEKYSIPYLSKVKLLKLREEIFLGSLYISDYENSLGIDSQYVCDFFTGYMDFLWELMDEDNIPDEDKMDKLCLYDTIDNLENYQNMVEYSKEDLEEMINDEHLYYLDDLFDTLEDYIKEEQ